MTGGTVNGMHGAAAKGRHKEPQVMPTVHHVHSTTPYARQHPQTPKQNTKKLEDCTCLP